MNINQTDQTDQTNQTDQTDQTNQTDQTDIFNNNTFNEKYRKLNLEEQQLVKAFIERPKITQKNLAILLSWNISTVKYYVGKLIKKGIIKREGTSHNGCWRLL